MINYSVCLLGNPQDEMAPEKLFCMPLRQPSRRNGTRKSVCKTANG